MEKNVFITSLSTMRKPTTNYYFTELNGPRRYFTGSFTNEPGAKYFLANKKADKLVIIGSDQTYDPGRPNAPVRIEEIGLDGAPAEEKALDYLKRQMAAFVRGLDLAPAAFQPPNEVRKKELMALIENYFSEKGLAGP